MKDTLLVIDCGLQPYLDTWRLQHRLVKARAEGRIPDILLLVEHPPIITLGRNGNRASIKVSAEILEQRGVSFMVVERGGDATFHGPGQILGYPIFLLPAGGRRVRAFVESLEEALIRVLRAFKTLAHRDQGTPGVWVGEAKIGSIGITVRNEVSFHGFALNVNTDLSGFGLIDPCGMRDVQVTSLEQCLGHQVPMDVVKGILVREVAGMFHLEVTQVIDGSFLRTPAERALGEQ
jgi:lipoate-protein ligase B